MEAVDEYKLRKLIKEIKNKKGQHTSLISLYIPAGYDIVKVLGQIQDEQGTANNIKSKVNRKNVVDALEKIIQHLKLFKQTPPNGLVIFCGNISPVESIQDIKIWSIVPPLPIQLKIYRCDQEFMTQPLEDMIAPKDVYGLIAIDNKEATIAILRGDRYTITKNLTSGYSGKHRAGGQSARRFERLLEEQQHNFRKRVGEHVNEVFLPMIKDLKGIVIGGPAMTKDDFVEGDYINHELKKKIIAVKNITYTDESGIRELVNEAKDELKNVQIVRQKMLMDRFMKGLIKEEVPVAYGKEVEKLLEEGAVDTLLLSEEIGEDLIDKFYELGKKNNSVVEIIPTDFEEGFQLNNTFGGIAALLRYKV